MTNTENNRTLIEPERSRFASSKLTPDVPDSVARLTVFHWVSAIFLVLLGVFTALNICGYQGSSEKIYGLLDKYFIVFAGAIGFYLKEQREKA